MKHPEIITSKDGAKILIVYYQSKRYDEAIQAAERRFNLKDDARVTVIALSVDFGAKYSRIGKD